MKPSNTSALALCLTLLTFPAFAEPMWFKSVSNGGNCTNCGWTIAEGEITRDTPAALRSYLAENGYPGRLMFDSRGGTLGAALELGRIIRENDLPTAVGRSIRQAEQSNSWYETGPGGTCESACAFAFLGGSSRTANEDDSVFAPAYGRLGMHQFYTLDGQDIPSTDTQQIMGQVLFYMLEMGINAELLTIAARTPPDRMHYFTRDELLDLGVLTFRGSQPRGLFIDRGGLATGWRARHENGTLDRTISLRCSAAAQAWVLRVRQHGPAVAGADPDVPFAPDVPGFDPSDPKDLSIRIGPNTTHLSGADIIAYEGRGSDQIIEVRLPGLLPAFAGTDFRFRTNELRNFQMALAADETLPDAETFDVLARACGD